MVTSIKFFFLLILLFSVVFAQEVQITEIQPFKVGMADEWFEFSIRSDNIVDLSTLQISNGKTTKNIGSTRDKLILAPGTSLLSGSGYSVDSMVVLPIMETFFTWTKSPISLTNSGGTIQILDAIGNILSAVIYPKGKSGTRKDYKYSEIFNWDSAKKRIYPLIFRNDGNPPFQHTKGYKNRDSPSFSEEVQIVISEISPNRENKRGGDFIEIYFAQGPDKINLKYAEIKYNGTVLYYFDDDFWVSPKQFLTIWVGRGGQGIVKNTAPYEIYSDKKSELSTGSGTVELILFSDTSYEVTEDFVCYKDEKLSKTEQNRVDKNSLNWKSTCVEIHDLIDNESIARSNLFSDSDTNLDFFRHFNGTPGALNEIKNKKPKAIITVQGTGKTSSTTAFSINLTGENSTDEDGKSDIIKYVWTLNGNIFSESANPKSFKLESLGTYKVILEITDSSGETDSVSQIFSIIPTGEILSSGRTTGTKSFIEKILLPQKSKKELVHENFFSDFLVQVPESFWDKLDQPPIEKSSFDPHEKVMVLSPTSIGLTRREKWIQKNIGWAFAGDSLDGLD